MGPEIHSHGPIVIDPSWPTAAWAGFPTVISLFGYFPTPPGLSFSNAEPDLSPSEDNGVFGPLGWRIARAEGILMPPGWRTVDLLSLHGSCGRSLKEPIATLPMIDWRLLQYA